MMTSARGFFAQSICEFRAIQRLLKPILDWLGGMPGFGGVIGAELTRRMKAFKKWFENHRHILALPFVSHKFATKNLIADQQCFSTDEPRRRN
jgi:hypothetical protein